MILDSAQFIELCEDTIPPFLRAAAAGQWDENTITEKSKLLAEMLNPHLKPVADGERAHLREVTESVYAHLSAKELATLSDRERIELEIASFAKERLPFMKE